MRQSIQQTSKRQSTSIQLFVMLTKLTCRKTFFIMLCRVLRRAGSYSRALDERSHLLIEMLIIYKSLIYSKFIRNYWRFHKTYPFLLLLNSSFLMTSVHEHLVEHSYSELLGTKNLYRYLRSQGKRWLGIPALLHTHSIWDISVHQTSSVHCFVVNF